ncbi:MAG: hypothetical protein PHO32_04570 [Candidatus Cloacimonetes bacterium]|nr:hypothetical protein [Candidatus Cloacimonadota bacterium]
MKHLILILCLLLIGSLALAEETNENAGKYGYKFLNVPSGPVSIALAGRGVHSPGNSTSFIFQPAASCENGERILGLSHSPWLIDTAANCLSYSYSQRTHHFGIAMRNLDYGELENRDDTGFLIGHYNPLDVDILTNYARRITPSFYLGINAGILYQKLNTATSLGAHTDLGLSYLPPLSGSKLSISARNLGLASKTNQETVKFPTSYEADISNVQKFGETSVMLAVAGIKGMDEDAKFSVSSEVGLLNMVSLRFGYKFNYAAENLSAGLGVAYRKVHIDYAYAAFSEELNAVHSIGVAYQF